MHQSAPERNRGVVLDLFALRDENLAGIRAVSDRLGLFLQLGWNWPARGWAR